MLRLLSVGLVALSTGLFAGTGVAEALSITPTEAIASGNETSTPLVLVAASAACACTISNSTELYKQNVGGGESGSLAGSYSTTFSNTKTDPSNATIIYTGGAVASSTYLLVKDGNQSPAWYLFNLSALGWNGIETLELSGFWTGSGAISHVALYGSAVTVFEPTTLSLLGASLLGLTLYRRRQTA